MKKMTAIAIALLATTATPALADPGLNLTGSTVTGTLFFPGATPYAGPFTTTVGSGVEFAGGTFTPAPQSIDIGASTISLFTNGAATYSTDPTFNGFVLDFTGFTGSLASLRVASNSTFQPVGFSVVGNSVRINLAGQSVGANDVLRIAAVPEAATWAMMIAGFGVVGVALRRRSSVRTTVRFA